jgi:hypothetical protein
MQYPVTKSVPEYITPYAVVVLTKFASVQEG